MNLEKIIQVVSTGYGIGNRTRSYLNPGLKKYGREFVRELDKIYCAASGIGDVTYETMTGIKLDNHIFCLYDTSKSDTFQLVLEYIRTTDAYETDYPFDHPTEGIFHMIVFKIHPSYPFAMKHFLASKYSKIYTFDELVDFIYDVNNLSDYQKKGYYVMTQNDIYRTAFEDMLNEKNDIASRICLPKEAELDYLIKLEEEIFNYVEEVV